MEWKDNSLIYWKEGGEEVTMERRQRSEVTEVELGEVGGWGVCALLQCHPPDTHTHTHLSDDVHSSVLLGHSM